MNITIVSKDAQLYRLCRELLADCLGIRCQLSVCASNGAPPPADLTIWDFCPELSLPEGIPEEPEHRHLFLVHRKHLQSFRERLPLAPGILLKPVTRAALGAFLEQRMAQHEACPQATSRLGALRADRDEMLQSLMLANLRLQEYDQDRTTFLNRAVHDFRAPLTALSGYCGLLLAEQLGPLNEQQRDVLERALRSAKRLSGIATAMFQLGVSRHCDTATPALAEGDLRDCVEQALHELTYLTDGKNLSVSVDLAPLPEPLLFDRAQVEQVLVNLLDNACRFTPKYGVIEIRGFPYFWDRRIASIYELRSADRRAANSQAPNCCRVDIHDSGPGIPPEHLGRIFEEYTSYSGGHDRSGGGLGLAICKMILTRHQGRIWAETRPTGAVFSFVLPFRRNENRDFQLRTAS